MARFMVRPFAACRSLPCPLRSVALRSAAAYFAGSTRVLCGKYSRAFRKVRRRTAPPVRSSRAPFSAPFALRACAHDIIRCGLSFGGKNAF